MFDNYNIITQYRNKTYKKADDKENVEMLFIVYFLK